MLIDVFRTTITSATRPAIRDALADLLVRFTRQVIFAPRDALAIDPNYE